MKLHNRRVFLAGAYNGGHGRNLPEDYREVRDGYPDLMDSYHYCTRTLLESIRLSERKIFLDSGAFSAFSLGAEIDVTAYGQFILKNQDIIEVASVLDGIGDPIKTLENQKRLEDMGAEVLPCFHYGEPEHYLEHYLENYQYITIGGMVPISTPQLHLWLDRIWKIIADKDGWPRVRVHGFGLTAIPLVLKYPWFSVDSSSWVRVSAFGSILVHLPDGRNIALSVSDKSPKVKDIDQHLCTLSPIEQEQYRRLFEKEGFTMQQLQEDYFARRRWNIRFNQVIREMPIIPFVERQPGLFE